MLAFNTTFCEPEAAETAAEKVALVAPAGTVIEEGTVTAELLLDKFTFVPPVGAAELSDTEQASVPDPMVAYVHVRLLTVGVLVNVPVPIRPILLIASLDELVVTVNWPEADPEPVGLKFTLTV